MSALTTITVERIGDSAFIWLIWLGRSGDDDRQIDSSPSGRLFRDRDEARAHAKTVQETYDERLLTILDLVMKKWGSTPVDLARVINILTSLVEDDLEDD